MQANISQEQDLVWMSEYNVAYFCESFFFFFLISFNKVRVVAEFRASQQ